jgi:hypothetical protein
VAFAMNNVTLVAYALSSTMPTQEELSDFFSDSVYPAFRYFDAGDTASLEQIPTGDYLDTNTVSMENL